MIIYVPKNPQQICTQPVFKVDVKNVRPVYKMVLLLCYERFLPLARIKETLFMEHLSVYSHIYMLDYFLEYNLK